MGTLTHGYAAEDSATVLLEFESGAQGVVDANFNIPDEASQNVLEVRGTKGAVYADHTIGQDAGGHMMSYIVREVGGYDAAQVRTGSIAEEVLVDADQHLSCRSGALRGLHRTGLDARHGWRSGAAQPQAGAAGL